MLYEFRQHGHSNYGARHLDLFPQHDQCYEQMSSKGTHNHLEKAILRIMRH